MMCYRFGDFVLDLDAFVLSRADEPLPLQPKAMEVLRYLIEHRGRMVSKSELLEQLWPRVDVNEAVISWSVNHIRRALGQRRADKQPIETVHSRGYRFTAEVSIGATEGRRTAPEPRASNFVGRERVMAELEQALREVANGRGQLCVVTGEAGIGKSRCLAELARCATALGLQAFIGRCPQTPGTPPLWPIDAAFAATGNPIAEGGESSDPERGVQGESALFDRIEGVARALRERARTRPTLLMLDDVHWADLGTLRLLEFIAASLPELPLCVVLAVRDGERTPGTPRDRTFLQVLRHAHAIPLGPLDSEQVGDLCVIGFGHRPSAELAEAVRRASGGIPLFVLEVVRSLAREHSPGALDRLRPDAVRIPALARDLLRERIDQLPKPTIELLAHAAVIGESFELSLLARLVALEPETLLERLAPAIVEGQLESEVPHAYRFAHSLLWALIYDDLLPAQRVTIHRSIAELLAERVDGPARAGEVARHYYLSLAAGDHEEVVRRARAAGEAARQVFAFDEAALYFGWALEAQLFSGVPEPRARAELLLALAAAERSAGRTADATESAARAIELAQQHRLHDLVVAATRLRRPTVALAMVPDKLTRSALELVLRQLPGASDPVRISAMSQLACVPPYARDLGPSKELSARALAMAEANGDRDLVFEALRARLFSLSGPDDIGAVLQVTERVLALEREGAWSWQSMDARVARVSAHLQAGRIADVDVALSEMDALLRGTNFGEANFYCQRMLAQRCFLDGRFDEAERRAKSVSSQAVRAGVAYAGVMSRMQLLHLDLDREGPKRTVEKHLSAASPLHRMPRPFRATIAQILAEAGELERARAELAALGDPSDHPRDGCYLHTLACYSVCAAVTSDAPRCEQLFELLSPYAGMNTPDAMGFYLGSVSHFLGMLLLALGRSGPARAHFEHALEHNRAMGYRAGVVRTLLALAELERGCGRPERAREAYETARREADALGMRGAMADIDAIDAALARS
jgi:DNA-binding winged helix-turn-helix (wHTH) protein/tetratricopeptide (TPR) repeat protein